MANDEIPTFGFGDRPQLPIMPFVEADSSCKPRYIVTRSPWPENPLRQTDIVFRNAIQKVTAWDYYGLDEDLTLKAKGYDIEDLPIDQSYKYKQEDVREDIEWYERSFNGVYVVVDDLDAFGKHIMHAMRLGNGLTEVQLAARLPGISPEQIEWFEDNEYFRTSFATMADIVDALGETIEVRIHPRPNAEPSKSKEPEEPLPVITDLREVGPAMLTLMRRHNVTAVDLFDRISGVDPQLKKDFEWQALNGFPELMITQAKKMLDAMDEAIEIQVRPHEEMLDK